MKKLPHHHSGWDESDQQAIVQQEKWHCSLGFQFDKLQESVGIPSISKIAQSPASQFHCNINININDEEN